MSGQKEENVFKKEASTKKNPRGTIKATGKRKLKEGTSEINCKKKVSRKRKLEDDEMGCCPSKEDKRKRVRKRSTKENPVPTPKQPRPSTTVIQPQPTRKYSTKYDWDSVDYIHEKHPDIGKSVIKNVINLLDEGSTVPFIARYRKAKTGGLDPDILRIIKEENERAKNIKHKSTLVLNNLQKSGELTEDLIDEIKSIKSLNELDHIKSLYKVSSKKLLAESAKQMGLGDVAEKIVNGEPIPHLKSLVNQNVDGLEDEKEVKQGIIYIIADLINKDISVIDKVKELRDHTNIMIETKKSKSTSLKNLNSNDDKNDNKYKMYYDWKISVKTIKSYNVMAINRAESEKIISVTVDIPSYFESTLQYFVMNLYHTAVSASKFHAMIIRESFNHAYKKSIKPTVIRRLRNELTERARENCMENFAKNVKNLLLTQPVRGHVILGIDPGFKHGCKLAIISEQGDLLETSKIYPHLNKEKLRRDAADTLAILVRKHDIKFFALGNGSGCRETEAFVSELIKNNLFRHHDIKYVIVDEAGSSENSIKSELQSEFPKLDCTLLSAISIARKLQDPLAELVKYDPKTMGVGMYQHDCPQKELDAKLNEVVSVVVSLVGVDVNTASRCLLRRVAGLSDARAVNIIEHRKTKGTFTNRLQLLNVKGIGKKVFEQCAGFIRILPETALASDRVNNTMEFNYLDQTSIHPESYEIANAFIEACNVDLKDLGTREFKSAVNIFAGQGYSKLATRFKTDETTLEMIIKALTMQKEDDIRLTGNAPVYRKSILSIDDLKPGMVLIGVVRNFTDWGAFVDIGVGKDGMIYYKKLNNEELAVGERVEVKIENIQIEPNKENTRISLILMKRY